MSEKKELRRVATALEQLAATPTVRNTAVHQSTKLPIHARLLMFAFSSEHSVNRARSVRRSKTIRAYVGPNGGGKSLAGVFDLLPSLHRGRTALSTVRILDHRTGEEHPLYEQFVDFQQLVGAKHVDVFADEIAGIANSRSSGSLSVPVQNKLLQLRRDDCTLTVTAPNFARTDVIIREVTQAVTECRGYFPKSVMGSDGEIALWSPRRIFRWRTYDTIEFDEWTTGKRDRATPLASSWFKGVGSDAFASYDTLDAVSMVRDPGDGDNCLSCGNFIPKNQRVRCKCGTPRPASAEADTPELGDVLSQHEHDFVDLSTAPTPVEKLEVIFDALDRSAHVGHAIGVQLEDGTVVV